MGGLRFTSGSKTAGRERVAVPGSYRLVDARLEGNHIAPLTLFCEPIRSEAPITAGAQESEAQLDIEWGNGQGSPHTLTLDVSRGVTFTVGATELRATIRNIGAGQAENVPTREWLASVTLDSAARIYAPRVHVRIPALAREVTSAEFFVPAYARHWRFTRYQPIACRVAWTSGAGALLMQHDLAAGDDRLLPVPSGADRFTVQSLDFLTMNRGRMEFELSI